MRSIAEAKLPIAILVGLMATSLGLKASLEPQADDPWLAQAVPVEDQLARHLQSEGFSVRRQDSDAHSSVLATRGECRLSARGASESQSEMTVYARSAAQVGRLRYLLAGRSYESPPILAIFLLKIKAKILDGFGAQERIPLPVALATSTGCAGKDFGLGDIRVPA